MATRLIPPRRLGLVLFAFFTIVTPATGDEEENLLRLIQGHRLNLGYNRLVSEEILEFTCSEHSMDLLSRRVLSHKDRQGLRIHDRYRLNGGSGTRAGEILGQGETLEEIFAAWMESDGHIAILDDPQWTRIGVSIRLFGDGRKLAVVAFSNSVLESNSILRMESRLYLCLSLISSHHKVSVFLGGYPLEPETDSPDGCDLFMSLEGRISQEHEDSFVVSIQSETRNSPTDLFLLEL